jgi:hypothetical protein
MCEPVIVRYFEPARSRFGIRRDEVGFRAELLNVNPVRLRTSGTEG